MTEWKNIIDVEKNDLYGQKIKDVGGDFRKRMSICKDGSLGLIIADPPWPYKNSEYRKNILLTYPTLGLEEMALFFQLAYRKLKANRNLWVWSDWLNVPRVIRYGRKAGFKYFALCVAKRRKLGLGYHVRKHCYFLIGLAKGKPSVCGHLTEYLGEFGFVGSVKPDQVVAMLLKHSLPKNEPWLDPFPATHIEIKKKYRRENAKIMKKQYDQV